MSGGRVEVGLGAGWYDAEHHAFGMPFPPTARATTCSRTSSTILHGVWTAPAGATFELEGRTCAVPIDADTVRPAQQPHPPIVLGGQGGRALGAARGGLRRRVQHRVRRRSRRSQGRARRGPAGVRAVRSRSGDRSSYSAGQVLCCGRTEEEIARRAAAIGREVAELRENGLAGTPAEVARQDRPLRRARRRALLPPGARPLATSTTCGWWPRRSCPTPRAARSRVAAPRRTEAGPPGSPVQPVSRSQAAAAPAERWRRRIAIVVPTASSPMPGMMMA